MPSPKRILKVIEGLTMGEFEHNDPQKSLEQIYTFAHLASDCKNRHEDWRKEFLEVEKFLIDKGIISDWQESSDLVKGITENGSVIYGSKTMGEIAKHLSKK